MERRVSEDERRERERGKGDVHERELQVRAETTRVTLEVAPCEVGVDAIGRDGY